MGTHMLTGNNPRRSDPQRDRILRVAFLVLAMLLLVAIVAWRWSDPIAPKSIGTYGIWLVAVISAALLLLPRAKKSDLGNEVGLALVSGLVLALAAFVINVVLEDAFESRDRARREAETKLAINRLDQRIFRGEDLSEFNLSGMSLVDPGGDSVFDLSFANMHGIGFESAVLRGARIEDATLTEADLDGADLTDALLTNSDLTDATMTRVAAGGAWFADAVLAGADLRLANLADANLSSVDLTRADLRGANLRGANLTGATLIHASFAVLGQGDDLLALAGPERDRNAVLVSANLSDTDLTGANFDGADLSRTSFEGSTLSDATFHGSNLTGAEVGDLPVPQVEPEATICSDGVAADEAGCVARTPKPMVDRGLVAPEPTRFFVAPNARIGTPIGRLVATDEEGDPVSFVRVDVPGRAEVPFTIDPASGVIRVGGPLAAGTRYELDVDLIQQLEDDDLPNQRSHLRAQVIVDDANHPPTGGIEFLVAADALPGTKIASIEGGSAGLEIVAGAEHFSINDQGFIAVKEPLGESSRYDIVVEARNEEGRSTATHRVAVLVVPPNEPPVAESPAEPIRLTAGRRPTGTLYDAVAVDPEGSRVTYAISRVRWSSVACDAVAAATPDRLEDHPFSVDAVTGAISLLSSPSLSPGCHSIMITASDEATIAQTASIVVRVEVGSEAVRTEDQRCSTTGLPPC